ncbi:cuticle protein-like [Episyrphus balteatus]|uniref:cuticle protein-like n=1 Tax=Episyrphus balteatus TaxID=286459 RepID=UPI0024853B54|nr:cuticle protein-like [Episyrphus balteatus]
MRTFTAILLFAAFAFCSADISLKLRENDFSHINDQGEYHFGFNDGHQARHEERSAEGVVRGAYRYIDANGEVQTVTYTADKHNGFLASGSSIPKIGRIPETGQNGDIIEEAPAVVEETPEVRAARAAHLEAHRIAIIGGTIIPQELPVQVQYTPEVAAARAEHINALNQERLRSLNYSPITYASQPEVQYYIPSPQYHPDYLPYAGL